MVDHSSLAIFPNSLQFRSRSAGPENNPKDKVFVGYLFGQPRDIHFSLYTHICHAFLVADGEGKVQPSRTVPSHELTEQGPPGGCQGAGIAGRLGLGQAIRVDCLEAGSGRSLREISAWRSSTKTTTTGSTSTGSIPTPRKRSSDSSGSRGGFARSSTRSARRKDGRCS